MYMYIFIYIYLYRHFFQSAYIYICIYIYIFRSHASNSWPWPLTQNAMRETETEESHRYNSETKPIHAQDLQLLRYGSWVWIMGYGSHAVPGYGSEPYILSCSHIVQYIYIHIPRKWDDDCKIRPQTIPNCDYNNL